MVDASSGAGQRAVPWWRFSLKQLLLATAIVALGCVALRNANATWVAAMFGLAWLALAASLLLALYREGPIRAFWIGFATLGWLYMLLLLYAWSFVADPNAAWNTPPRRHNLITTHLAHVLYDWFFTEPEPRGIGGTGPMQGAISMTAGSMGPYPGGMSSADGGMMPGAGGIPGMGMGGMPGGMGGGPTFTGPSQDDFTNVAHTLWTLLLAFCGGWFARWVYATRGR
jgi:hypothetical protein